MYLLEFFYKALLDANVCSIDLLVPSWTNLPATLAKSHYQNPIDNLHTGLQAGLKIDYHGFEFLARNPKIFNDFNIFMSAQREGRAYWLDFYPFDQKLSAESRDSEHDVIFVDVGGALGSEILELRKRFPALKGRMILQELPQTIEHVSPDPGMEATVHDFFTPQPIKGTNFSIFPPCSVASVFLYPGDILLSAPRACKFQSSFSSTIFQWKSPEISLTGAQIYYLRNVLHDWPDPLARVILQQISSAMTAGVSRLLINELVVPIRGCGQFAPHSDFNMMSICAGMERTEAQWKGLLESVGLEIQRIWTGDGDTESIIEAVPAGPTK